MAKHDYEKILTRLRIILQRLNDGEELSVTDLAKEFKLTTKTIQRDFNKKLLPIYPIEKNGHKWKMQDGFRIEKTSDIEDIIVLDIIEKITEGIGGKFAAKAHSLLSRIKNEDFNPIYTKLNIEDITNKFKEIQIIESAIKAKIELECIYDNEKDTPYTTKIKPLKIVNYEGYWYLISLSDDILKKYYLRNISNIKLTDNYFTLNEKLDDLLKNSVSIWFQKDVEPYEVKIYADKDAAKYFKRRPLPTQIIESFFQDGSIEFVIKITHEMEILPIVKYWLPHLRIIEPQWIQDIINKNLQDYLKV